MYCNKCQCEFPDWVHKCPSCKTFLAKEMSPQFKELLEQYETAKEKISYEELVRLVKENGGQLKIDLVTTDVGMEKKYGFPYQGFGFAWTQEMSGECGRELRADLVFREVKRNKRWTFPFFGFGFAWVDKLSLKQR